MPLIGVPPGRLLRGLSAAPVAGWYRPSVSIDKFY